MTDRQLIAALRDLERPAAPDSAFADALFTRLRTQVAAPSALPRMLQLAPIMRMALILALLLIGLLASALVVGALVRLLPVSSTNPLYVGAEDGLYVAAEDRRQLAQLRGDGAYIEPRASASGKYIAAGFVDGNALVALRFLTPDGHLAGQLVANSDVRAWSTTTDEVALVVLALDRPDEPDRIAFVRPDGSPRLSVALPQGVVPYQLDWAPDASRLAMATAVQRGEDSFAGEVRIMNVATGDAEALVVLPDRAVNAVRWSPDGRRLAFVTSDPASGAVVLNVIDLDGADPVVLSDAFPLSASIDWSPDGDRIVFAREVGEQSDLFTIGHDGSGLVRLTDDPLDDLHPRWSPDGREIAFERRQVRPDTTAVRSETWVVRADGASEQMVRDEWLGVGWGVEPVQPVDAKQPNGVMMVDYALARARHGHSATALPRGPVLVAGGVDGEVSDSIEMLNIPGDISQTGSLLEARVDHSATLLPDGRVLFVGGRGSGGEHDWLSSAEVWEWEPMTGDSPPSSRPAGTLAIGRAQHTATVLQDGRVLVIGGWGSRDAVPISSVWEAEAWDPQTEAFHAAGYLDPPIGDHTATLLRDGRVLVLTEQSAWLWEAASESFRAIGSPLDARSMHTATLLADGRVLIVGGYTGLAEPSSAAHTSVEVFDATTETFRPAGRLIEGRGGHTATLLVDGRVLVAGGDSGGPGIRTLASTELWDPITEEFSPGPALNEARTGHVALLRRDDDYSYLDQRVLLAGGLGDDGVPLASAEQYYPFWLP